MNSKKSYSMKLEHKILFFWPTFSAARWPQRRHTDCAEARHVGANSAGLRGDDANFSDFGPCLMQFPVAVEQAVVPVQPFQFHARGR
jgi:hypothetical protein